MELVPYIHIECDMWMHFPSHLSLFSSYSCFEPIMDQSVIIHSFSPDMFSSAEKFYEYVNKSFFRGKLATKFIQVKSEEIYLSDLLFDFGMNWNFIKIKDRIINVGNEIKISDFPLHEMKENEIEEIVKISNNFSNIYEMILPSRETILNQIFIICYDGNKKEILATDNSGYWHFLSWRGS